MKQVSAQITETAEITPWANLIWLEAPALAVTAKPGQFVMVRCGEDTLLRRPLSLHRIDRENGHIALLFNLIGKGTKWLSQRKPGDDIDLFGPLGNGFSIPKTAKKLLLVAGGMGIAPLYFLAQEAPKNGYEVTLIHGVQTAVQLPNPLLPITGVYITVSEDGSIDKHGRVTDYLYDNINLMDQVYACGPLPMYKAMAQMPELKDRPVQVSLEVVMGCGLGICYGCTVKTRNGLRQVCRDGPVFNLADILWDEMVPVGEAKRELQ